MIDMIGDCRCLPKIDKEDLIGAINLAKDFYATDIKIAEKSLFPNGISETREKLRNVFDLEFRIREAPVCNKGDILDNCTCFSDFEKESIDSIVDPAIRILEKTKNKDNLNRLELIKKTIKNTKSC